MIALRYHEAAELELLNEIDYLEARSIGLGRRFFAEVQNAELMISRFPESAIEVFPGIRRRVLRKFPHALIYAFEGAGALILAVAHLKRRPNYWQPRAG